MSLKDTKILNKTPFAEENTHLLKVAEKILNKIMIGEWKNNMYIYHILIYIYIYLYTLIIYLFILLLNCLKPPSLPFFIS